MQKKIGTLLDQKLLNRVKEKVLEEHTTLSHLFEKALTEYLAKESRSKQRFSMVETSFGVIRLPREVVERIAQEDIYEVE
jgi:hypothetical protein